MVFVNDKKYACETCIKGHRSSTCNHTDRPLFEIKKKGRPITQCEHCRELRKTKQVHVKCLCEGKEDHEAISHSIPAKKANRKGPVPSAAFPHGLQHKPDLIEISSVEQADAPKDGSAQRCACKTGKECDCCAPRHPPRIKRSPTPPRPRMGELRAAATSASRSSSDLGDTLESSHPHQLTHGHGSRLHHGAALYNPYGLAHGVHSRIHGHLQYPSSSDEHAESSYPTATLSADQRETASSPDQQQGQFVQPSDGTLSDNVDDFLAALNASGIDIDTWIQQISGQANMLSVDTTIEGVHSAPSSAVSSLPSSIPQALDISEEALLRSNREDAHYGLYSSLLPQLVGLDVNGDYNTMDQSFQPGDGDNNGNDGSGVNSSGTSMYDVNLIGYTSSAQPPSSEYSELLPAPRPFPAFSGVNPSSSGAQFMGVPFLERQVQSRLGSSDHSLRSIESQPAPHTNIPPLSRSSSTGSHSSSRSRCSLDVASNDAGIPHESWPRIRDSDELLRSADGWAQYPIMLDAQGDWVPSSGRSQGQVHIPSSGGASMSWTCSVPLKSHRPGPLPYT